MKLCTWTRTAISKSAVLFSFIDTDSAPDTELLGISPSQAFSEMTKWKKYVVWNQLFHSETTKNSLKFLTIFKGASLRRKKVVQKLSKTKFWIGWPKPFLEQLVELPKNSFWVSKSSFWVLKTSFWIPKSWF